MKILSHRKCTGELKKIDNIEKKQKKTAKASFPEKFLAGREVVARREGGASWRRRETFPKVILRRLS